jgi:hypothetical protein
MRALATVIRKSFEWRAKIDPLPGAYERDGHVSADGLLTELDAVSINRHWYLGACECDHCSSKQALVKAPCC